MAILDSSGRPLSSVAQVRTARANGGPAHLPAAQAQAQTGLYTGTRTATTRRGRVPFFSLDPRKQLRRYDRLTLVRFSNFLMENFGPAQATWTLGELIGFLRPQAQSADKRFNEAAESRWHDITDSPLFDAAGMDSFPAQQILSSVHALGDGDFFHHYGRNEFDLPELHCYEGWQVGNGSEKETENWVDGIEVDARGRPQRFRFLDRGGVKVAHVADAAYVFHYRGVRARKGVLRPPPILAGCLNLMADVMEANGFDMMAIKAASLSGLAHQSVGSNAGPMGIQGIGGALRPQAMSIPELIGTPVDPNYDPAVDPPETAAEKPRAPKLTMEDVVEGGIMLNSDPGRRWEVVGDERPSPNRQEFKKTLLHFAAVGIGLPPQALYFFDDPGGPWTRYLIQRVAEWVIVRQLFRLLPFCRRTWPIVIGNEIAAGRVPAPSDPLWWRKVKWFPRRRISIDLGREGSLTIAMRKALMTTYADHYEELGHDWEEQIEQCGREARLVLDTEKKYDLPPGMLANALNSPGAPAPIPAPSTAPAAAAAPPGDDDTEKIRGVISDMIEAGEFRNAIAKAGAPASPF